jgi:molybdate transport system substrate-binding protein
MPKCESSRPTAPRACSTQQLTNHAPFDLFLSADVQYPRKLSEQGLILPGSEFTYADGRIVLWASTASGVDVERLGMDALRQPAVRHIAIANPAHAPYGRAAEAALRSLGVYDAVKDKLVMGENISQTFQMAESGAAEVGIVALSLAMAPAASGQGRYWEVPRDAYPRIQQGGAILKWTRNPAAAQAFRAFLLAPEGRAILKRYGFSD